MHTRVCKSCAKELEYTGEFWPTRHGKPTGNECRRCNSARVCKRVAEKRKVDLDYAKRLSIKTYARNKARYATDAAYRAYMSSSSVKYHQHRREIDEAFRQKGVEAGLLWARKNRGKATANVRARELAKIKRTPKWLSAEDILAIRNFYKLAVERSITTKIRHEVDHILPLRGKLVSGLHVPGNLRVITITENRGKGNEFSV